MQAYQNFRYMSDHKHDPNLTPQAVLLLEALREANDWINRSELARRTEKSALNKWDMVLLGKLAEAGLIETRHFRVMVRLGTSGSTAPYRSITMRSRQDECLTKHHLVCRVLTGTERTR